MKTAHIRLGRVMAAALPVILVVLVAVGCGDDGSPSASPSGASATTEQRATTSTEAPAPTETQGGQQTMSTATEVPPPSPTVSVGTLPQVVGVYFADADGNLVREERPAPAGDPVRVAAEMLFAGPGSLDRVPAIPAGARLNGVRHADGRVTIDFDRTFEREYPSGGAAAEQAIVGAIVRTLSEAAGGDPVLITVDGRTPEPLGSQYDWSQPFTAQEFGG